MYLIVTLLQDGQALLVCIVATINICLVEFNGFDIGPLIFSSVDMGNFVVAKLVVVESDPRADSQFGLLLEGDNQSLGIIESIQLSHLLGIQVQVDALNRTEVLLQQLENG